MSNFEQFILSITCKQLKTKIKFNLGTFYEIYNDFYSGITASYFGYDSLLEWINCLNLFKSTIVCYNLATRGHFLLLKKAVFNNYPLTDWRLFTDTFKNGQIDIIKWLVSMLNIKRDNLEYLIETEFINSENGKELFKYIINNTALFDMERRDITFNLYKMDQIDLKNWIEDKFKFKLDDLMDDDDNEKFNEKINNCLRGGNLSYLKALVKRYNAPLPEDSMEIFISYNAINDDYMSKEKYYIFLNFLKMDANVELKNIIQLALHLCRSEILIWALENIYNGQDELGFTYKEENLKNVLQDVFDHAICFLNLDEVKYFYSKGCQLNSEKILKKKIFKISDYSVLEFLNNNSVIDKKLINLNQQQPLINIFLEKSEIVLPDKIIEIWINKFESTIDSNTLQLIITNISTYQYKNKDFRKNIKKMLYDCIEKFNMTYNDETIKNAEYGGLFFFIKYVINNKGYKKKSIKLQGQIESKNLKNWINYIKYLLSKKIPWDHTNENMDFWELPIFKKINSHFETQNNPSFQMINAIEEIKNEYERGIFNRAVFLIERGCPCPNNIQETICKFLFQATKTNSDFIIYNKTFWNL
jgi:hypothetical protein